MQFGLAVGTMRLSVGRETTKEEIDIAVEDLSSSLKNLSYSQ